MKDSPREISVYDIIPRVHLEPIVLPDNLVVTERHSRKTKAQAEPEPTEHPDLVAAYSVDTDDINSFENIINKHKGEKK